MEHAGPGQNPDDPYRVLGVSASASQRDITRAYRRAAQHAHPDTRPHDRQAAAQFQALTDAYHLLRDPDRRADYDRGQPATDTRRQPPPLGPTRARPRPPGWPFPLGPPPGQLIWAGPVHVEPFATAPAARAHGHGAQAAEPGGPPVILGVRAGQVWGWPW